MVRFSPTCPRSFNRFSTQQNRYNSLVSMWLAGYQRRRLVSTKAVYLREKT